MTSLVMRHLKAAELVALVALILTVQILEISLEIFLETFLEAEDGVERITDR